jgi:hypothetical protein
VYEQRHTPGRVQRRSDTRRWVNHSNRAVLPVMVRSAMITNGFRQMTNRPRRMCGEWSNHMGAKWNATTGVSLWMIESPSNQTPMSMTSPPGYRAACRVRVGAHHTERSTDPKDGTETRRADTTKHDMSRDLLQHVVNNQILCR